MSDNSKTTDDFKELYRQDRWRVDIARRIIKITSCGVAENSCTQCEMMLHALCDDGTVWEIDNRGAGWRPMPPIPQGSATDGQ